MKKVIFLLISVLFISKGFSQNVDKSSSLNYNIQIQLVDSARTFVVNYTDGDQFRKKLILAWGKPGSFQAGTIEWPSLSLNNIGNNLKVTLIDGVETTNGTSKVFNAFADNNSKFNLLNSLQSNQKRKITLVITNQQGANVVANKSIEKSVLTVLDNIVTSVW